MHLRKLVLACGFASLALSNYASALGLGEVKLKSTLNQPLSAEVQLLDTRDLSAEQIIIALGSPADFERNGVERLYFYTEFQFEVDLNHPGGPVVRITTRDPVREPYLNFLIEARWTSGRLLREYTVLMDLPTFDSAAPKAVQAPAAAKPRVSSKARVETAAPAATSSSSSQRAVDEEKPDIIAEQDNSTKKSKVGSGTYGPIGAKDTLWDIATAVRPDSSVSVYQTMLALQRLNPEAFIHGNINLIRKGQVLRVPDVGEISSVSKSEAVSQVNSQISDWANGSGAALGAQLDASKHTASTRRDAEPVAGHVKLAAPSAASQSNGQGSGANKGSGKALESELAATLEELDKAKSEKTELSSRVHDLEEQVKTMQRLVDVSNEKLRAMQLNAGRATAAAEASAPASVAAQASLPAQASVATTSAAPSAVIGESDAVSSAAAPTKPAVKPAVKKVIRPAPAPVEKSLVDQLSDNITYVGAGALALIALVGVLLMRRRKAQAEQAANQAAAEESFDSEPDFSAFAQAHEEPVQQEAPVDEMSLFDEEDTTAVAETGDVVGEADIYIAYGKYEQAEEMLLNGLAKDPANTDIRLKLLEVYSQTQNLAEFDKHYSVILPLATGFALSRAAELRSNIPGAAEFGAPQGGGADLEPLENIDEEAAILAAQTDSQVAEDDFSFDLDLDDNQSDLQASPNKYDMDLSDKPSEVAGLDDDDFSFDFDEPAAKAEDLSDISLALDELEDESLPEDVELGQSSSDEEFSFDFNEMDTEESSLAGDLESVKGSGLSDDEALGDDFNFDVDVNDLDLAALDHEMESLDKLEEPVAAEGDLTAVSDDFNFDDLDLEETDFTLETSALETGADVAALDTAIKPDENLAVVAPRVADDLAAEDFSFEKGLGEGAEAEFTLEDDFVLEDADADDETSLFEETDLSLADDESDLNFDAELEAPADDEFQALDDIPEIAVASPSPAPSVAEENEDDLFEQALSDLSNDGFVMDETSDMSDDSLDDDLDFMNDVDEAATKLDLARAYMDMGDNEGARDILAEVASEGNDEQRQEAANLLSRMDA